MERYVNLRRDDESNALGQLYPPPISETGTSLSNFGFVSSSMVELPFDDLLNFAPMQEPICGAPGTLHEPEMNTPRSMGSASVISPFGGLEGALNHSMHLPEEFLLHYSDIDGSDATSQDKLTMPSEPLPSNFEDFDSQKYSSHNIPVADTERWQTLNPLDRWRNSPPETEAAHLTDIINSLARSKGNSSSESRPGSRNSATSYRRRPKWQRNSPSVAASDSTMSTASSSSASSAHSFGSDQSGSFGRFYLEGSTRRRRRHSRKASPVPRGRSDQKSQRRPYQCTFCTDTFKSKYDWTRHEKTLHLPLESWACAPFGPTYKDGSTGAIRCAFCDVNNPSEGHIEEHNYKGCQDKPSALRTFYRKDHLRQHLRLVHGIRNAISNIASWKSEMKDVNSRCGFCAMTFTRWSDRNDHIAGHYKEGVTMKDWKGCRGFIPAMALAVDNAMPPYLIGSESTGIDPFSASRRGKAPCPTEGKASCQDQEPVIIQPTPFEQLTEHLVRYVRAKQADGIPITDESIQKEARCLLYGDDDPWNQTAADNLEWLSFFKDGMGINSSASMTNAISSHICSAPVFPLPWTVSSMENVETPEERQSREVETAGLIDQWMPWAWQSPECLAEFRRFNNAVSSRSGIDQALDRDQNDQV